MPQGSVVLVEVLPHRWQVVLSPELFHLLIFPVLQGALLRLLAVRLLWRHLGLLLLIPRDF